MGQAMTYWAMETQSDSVPFAVVGLFILAGFLAGGTWAFYQKANRAGMFILGALTVVATATAIVQLISAYS